MRGVVLTTLSGSDAFWNKGHGRVWSPPAQPHPQSVQSSLPPTLGKSLSGKVLQVQSLGRHSIPKGAPRLLRNGWLPFPKRAGVLDGGVSGDPGGGFTVIAAGLIAEGFWDICKTLSRSDSFLQLPGRYCGWGVALALGYPQVHSFSFLATPPPTTA